MLKTFEILYQFILRNETLTGTVIGAIIAALMGIAASTYLEWKRNKREQKKYLKLLLIELSQIIKQIKLLREEKQGYPLKGKIIPSNNWVQAKIILSTVLTAKEVYCIDKLYVNLAEFE